MNVKRLTGHLGKYVHIRACSGLYLNQERKSAPASNAVVRLTAIEDILGDEYDLDRLRELVKARDEGRAPCKVGDTVYWLHGGAITECRVHRIQWNRSGLFLCLKSTVSHGAFRVDSIGKTVFLTREEAEAALGGVGNG